MATIDSHYFIACVRGAERNGFNAKAFYRRAGIRLSRLARPGSRETVERMASLVRDIWTAMDNEFMGYTRSPARSGAFAVMAEYAFHSDSVLEALKKGVEFYRVISDDIVTTLEEENDVLLLRSRLRRPELDPDHYFMEFWLIIWHRLACWFAGETIPLLSAEFSYPRPVHYFEEFKHLFPCGMSFDKADCRLYFDSADLATPIRRSEKELKDMIARAPLDLMTIPASDHSFARKVYVVLRPWEQGVFKARSADEVAAVLGVSGNVMRRALNAEGTHFKKICEDIRRDLACAKLRNTQDTIESIANDLGYLETRSFTRAFRLWTGFSPTEFRRMKIEG